MTDAEAELKRKDELKQYLDNDEFRTEMDWIQREAMEIAYRAAHDRFIERRYELVNRMFPDGFELTEDDWYLLTVMFEDDDSVQ